MTIRASLFPLLIAACLTAGDIRAADEEFPPQVWINFGALSYHFDRSKDLRENNIGLGAEVLLARDHAVMAGTYLNSDNARTHYAAYLWRPLHWKPAYANVSAGVAVGAFDGYPRVGNGGWFVAPLPVLAIEGRYIGANFTIVPTIENHLYGAIAVQFKLRVW